MTGRLVILGALAIGIMAPVTLPVPVLRELRSTSCCVSQSLCRFCSGCAAAGRTPVSDP